MNRKASAVWNGALKDGNGTVSTESGAIANKPYSFSTRFENEPGTNPEELIGAAHAGCFSMALSAELAKVGINPQKIETTADVKLEKGDAGFSITGIHLDTTVTAPGADEQAFQTGANNAKAGCPVSRVLNTNITMTAKLA